MTQDTQAGAQPAPAQQPKTLRELAEVVKDWGARDQAWPDPDPECYDVAQFGHISEEGEMYPVAEVNADTYGHEGVSLQLAQFYAAASPAAVLALLDRVELRDGELKAAHADIQHWRSNHDNVVARLRIFTQRPDLPKELADRLPWYRELVRLQEVEAQAAAKCMHLIAEPAAWMDLVTMDVINDARKQAWARDYGAGGAAKAAAYTVALGPLASAADARVDCIGLALELESQVKRVESQSIERAMLAAANGLRLMAYRAAPAPDERDVLAAPAVAVPDDFRGDTDSLVRNIIALLELDAEGALVPHGVSGHARGLLSAAAARLATAPSQEHATQLAGGAQADEMFELWWAHHMPEATQAHAWAAWTAGPGAAAPAQAQEAAPALEAPVSMPQKPTPDMRAAFRRAYREGGFWADRLDYALDQMLAAAPQAPAAPVPWLPYLSDRADGVRGHYAIARHNPAGYREVWNLHRHHWGSFSDDVLTLDEALAILQKLAMPTTAPAAPAVDARAKRDAAFEAVRNRLCGLQRYSFVLDDDGVVRRAQDRTGNWIEFDDAHELFDPIAVDAAIAAQAKGEQRDD